ncbi:MAG: efflux RND transporter periplasmic adaptor subunit [Phycisphaeraceae bacterium]|nr:efflux RND transporter periplasmic adaptor subunit [Phycisphaerales bacterium]MCB9861114.1 efflux RND transporter periplasmic adaptor subunit [Phycisphaeraceae bacterium]
MTGAAIQQTGNPRAETPDFSRAKDIFAQIVSVAQSAPSTTDFVRLVFRAVASNYKAVYAVMHVEVAGRVVSDDCHTGTQDPALWKTKTSQFLTQAQVLSKPKAKLFEAKDVSVRIALLSCPIADGEGKTIGAIAMVVPCKTREDAHEQLAEFRACTSAMSAGIGLLTLRQHQQPASAQTNDISGNIGTLATVSQRKGLHELAFAITNTLRSKLGCEQVALGRVHGKRARLLSISGFDKLSRRSPGVAAVADAMEECLDHGSTVVCQSTRDAKDPLDSDFRIHRAWQAEAQGATVASIPLATPTGIEAVISIRLMPGKQFSKDELAAIEKAVEPYALAIGLVDRATRSLVGHAVASAHHTARDFVNPASAARRLGCIACCLGAYWFATASIPFRVTVPAVVTPATMQHMVAPFDAPVAEIFVGAGDKVTQGQLLCKLDTRMIEIQRAEADANLKSVSMQADIARAAGELARAEQLSADIGVQEARRAMFDAQLEAASVRSPVDGVVMIDTVSDHIGQMLAVGAPMFQIAPTDSMRIELEVAESVAARIHTAKTAQFSSSAMPEEHYAMAINHRLPMAEVRNGRTVFVSYAEIEDGAVDWLRPGMKGVARVDAGERKAWWVVLRKAIDFANMRLWL